MLSVGPWVGLQTWEMLHLHDALDERRTAARRDQALENRTLGRRTTIPLFSNGLQGRVIGFFLGVGEEQTNAIYTTLLQFGQTLADVYAELRVSHFVCKRSPAHLLPGLI
jgi:hypothetical protein